MAPEERAVRRVRAGRREERALAAQRRRRPDGLSLVYLGQCAEGNAEINYELEVRGSEPGTLSLVATAPCIRQLEGFEAKKFLFVPDADWGPSGVVSVAVSYW